MGQLRLFADVARRGDFLRVSVDTPLPHRQPAPRSDLRLSKIPLGPVAVFGASNFPLAFSVAGGDTASALAAGAPVIVKAHSAHLGTSELVGRAVQQAVRTHALHEGVFSLLFGAGRTIGEALVGHACIKAVGFTGSRQGGLALVKVANARLEPIPVYAEMSSINPVYLMDEALNTRAETLAQSFATSLTMGAGQFCTNPGLVIAIDGPNLQRFVKAAGEALANIPQQTMLTAGIHQAYQTSTGHLRSSDSVLEESCGVSQATGPNAAVPALFSTDAQSFMKDQRLREEAFGPAAIIVRAQSVDEMIELTETLEGQLTATLLVEPADFDTARRLVPILERKAGRILVNGFPTGVEVSHAMVHGGPFPSTSNSMYTSVGASAIDRFLRPVCYQDFPDELSPDAIRTSNPLKIGKFVDGIYQSACESV